MASTGSHDIVAAFKAITGKAASTLAAAGLPQKALVLAVSKTKTPGMIKEVYNTGHRHFGENYVNEMLEKAPKCPEDVKWHFIGHLQSNKAAKIAALPNLYMVESVDSLKLAQKLDQACQKVGRPTKLNVLIQVNTSGEESKSGCEPAACATLVQQVVTSCPALAVRGLMTIGQYEAEPSSAFFDTLKQCKADVVALLPELDTEDFVLSMGMSHDMELALQSGSTEVRVGTAIFGPRGVIYPTDSDDE